MDEKKPKKMKKKWLWIVLGVVVLLALIGSCNGGDKETKEPEETAAIAETEAPDDNQETAEESAAPAETEEASAAVTTYKAGMYKVGSDLPAGEYFVTSKGSLAYVEVASDSTGTLDSIITNENLSSFMFVTVSDGQYLTVKGATFVAAEDAVVPEADSNGVYGSGMYRVGTDIEAGEYKVTCTNGMLAYVEVSADSRGVLDSIITNENIEDSTYITVSDGQYLKVNGGEFTK